ncbi:SCO family protein [Paenibacillus athensensis]|uniref:Thioredoxin domain-containing protein n=1 Tax=Paenibacillus athensensis TaxID=1967502 RepID=A0A4Y8PYL0_9BACL|nr:SCO family protein [Paenibacillus athensensis]MCD1261235.1 SCO family protein [Paenibacillus athensensis]
MSTDPTRKRPWLRVFTLVIFAAIVVCIAVWFRQGTESLPRIKAAPDFTLQNLQDQPVKLSDSAGKTRLLEFFFASCPDICPATTSHMAHLQENLKSAKLWGDKVQFLSITFDPERDTPDALAEYAKLFGIDTANWTLIRGTEEETLKTANDFGLMVVKQNDGQFAHSIRSLFLIDQDGYIRRVFDMGENMNEDEVEQAIVQLAK